MLLLLRLLLLLSAGSHAAIRALQCVFDADVDHRAVEDGQVVVCMSRDVREG